MLVVCFTHHIVGCGKALPGAFHDAGGIGADDSYKETGEQSAKSKE